MREIYTDGASRGNPGLAGIGVYIKPNIKHSKFLGVKTNNYAEYSAILEAYNLASEDKELIFYIDSELAVKQLNGEYKVKNPELKKLYDKIKEKEKNHDKVTYKWVPREKNKIADQLANEAINNR